MEHHIDNKATPVYYGIFRDMVLRGEVPVNEELALEMNRIDALILNPEIYYDEQAVEGYIRYCENELTLTDGSDLKLLFTFKLWAEQLLSWYYYVDVEAFIPDGHGGGKKHIRKELKRLTNKQFLVVARGAAKSMYLMTMQSFFLNVYTATTHQITTAPTMKQADEALSPIRTAITRARGPLFKFLTAGSLRNTNGSPMDRVKLVSTKKGIENRLTGSLIEIRPMTVNKLQGLRPFLSTVDEWLSGDTREDPIGAIEQGASKLSDYIIIAVSSEGTVRNAAGDSMKLELVKILKGEYTAPHVSIFYYKLDSVEEVADPRMWLKANPNLGSTVTYDTYARDVTRAEQIPSARNDILAKRFGLPMEGYTYFFTYDETVPQTKRSYKGMACALGADLSQGDDFCAFNFMFPLRNGGFGNVARCYITEHTLHKLRPAMRIKYEEFITEGSLVVMPGVILDIPGSVYDDLIEFIEMSDYDVISLGYDPYNAAEFIHQWTIEHSEYGVEVVRQGFRTESVPLGELKNLAYERLIIFHQSIIQFAMGNSMVLQDTNGNQKLYKRRHDAKIDPVAAMMDGYVSWKLNREAYE